jgi:hypothetical protein
MSVAPEPILRAGNETVTWACVFCRNQTLKKDVSVKMVNEVMEAIHEVPRMLANWERHDIAELRTHLGCFMASRWEGAPDLVAFFDQRLKEYSKSQD